MLSNVELLVHTFINQSYYFQSNVLLVIQVLSVWLGSTPNFDEVTKWYTGWKGMLDMEILSDPIVKRK